MKSFGKWVSSSFGGASSGIESPGGGASSFIGGAAAAAAAAETEAEAVPTSSPSLTVSGKADVNGSPRRRKRPRPRWSFSSLSCDEAWGFELNGEPSTLGAVVEFSKLRWKSGSNPSGESLLPAPFSVSFANTVGNLTLSFTDLDSKSLRLGRSVSRGSDGGSGASSQSFVGGEVRVDVSGLLTVDC